MDKTNESIEYVLKAGFTVRTQFIERNKVYVCQATNYYSKHPNHRTYGIGDTLKRAQIALLIALHERGFIEAEASRINELKNSMVVFESKSTVRYGAVIKSVPEWVR